MTALNAPNPNETRTLSVSALPKLLSGEGAHARARSVLEAIELAQLGVRPNVAPHSVFEELWHLVYWQDFLLAWAAGERRAYPEHAAESFPDTQAPADLSEARDLTRRFLEGINKASALAASGDLDRKVLDEHTLRSLLETLLAHNSYHLGRIVLLRQLIGIWPPPSGGDTW